MLNIQFIRAQEEEGFILGTLSRLFHPLIVRKQINDSVIRSNLHPAEQQPAFDC